MAVASRKTLLLTVLITGWLTVGSAFVSGQTTTLREFKFRLNLPDTTFFLADWVQENSVEVFAGSEPLSDQYWEFDQTENLLRFKQVPATLVHAGVIVTIRFIELKYPVRRIYTVYQPRSISLETLSQDSLATTTGRNDPASVEQGTSELYQKGSLSRGIIVGSNQDFALESGLQFELSGKLTEDVSLNAVLTDRSIPVQPDGTTQNLREFDKVLIQLESERTRVEMGDVDVSFTQSTFAKLNRRLQGAAGTTRTEYGNYQGVVSSVRGTFTTKSFSGEDGVQGPYRLTGKNGEEFIIILAGTERVYLNGEQVQRGEENEYIIDYSLGEIYFTKNVFIKDETRIFVEYEYVDQNFNRTLIAAEGADQFLDGKLGIGITFIRSADSDQLLAQQTLSEEDIELLQSVGDNLNDALVSGVSFQSDDEVNIRYAQIDTVYNGQTYQIFKHIPGASASNLVVSFSKVGQGNGDYARVSNTANGLLYEWVGPGNGAYSPYRQLPAPEKQEMLALNSRMQITPHIYLFGEGATSAYDKNRFSSIDDDDNFDVAYLGGISVTDIKTEIGNINLQFKRRYSGSHFEYFERTKEVEFDRKWNLSDESSGAETSNEAEVQLNVTENSGIGIEYGSISKTNFSGVRQASSLQFNEYERLTARYTQDWVRSNDRILGEDGRWFRQTAEVMGKPLSFVRTELRLEQERRVQRKSNTGELTSNSFAFVEAGPGVGVELNGFRAFVGMLFRQEERVFDNVLKKESDAWEQQFELDLTPSPNFSTKNQLRLRTKTYEVLAAQQGNANQQGFLLESVTDYQTGNEIWKGQFYYQANTERRALLQESYFETGPELGQYVWIDENEDGIEQIDEFFPELSPNEGIYVRQFLPSDELLPVIDLNVRIRNQFTPFSAISGSNGMSYFLKSMHLSSRIQLSENSTTSNLEDVYLLRLNTFRNDSTTLQGHFFWEQELEFSPRPNHRIQIGFSQSRLLNKQSNDHVKGFNQHGWFNGRSKLDNRFGFSLKISSNVERSLSSTLASRSFDIRSVEVTPGLDATISRSWQTAFSFSFAEKEDRLPEETTKVRILKLTNSHRTYFWEKIQMNSTVEYRSTTLSGSPGTFSKFQLTEGTGSGQNLIWSLSGSYRISQLVRMSVNYDGRTVENRPDIHTVKIVVSAVF